MFINSQWGCGKDFLPIIQDIEMIIKEDKNGYYCETLKDLPRLFVYKNDYQPCWYGAIYKVTDCSVDSLITIYRLIKLQEKTCKAAISHNKLGDVVYDQIVVPLYFHQPNYERIECVDVSTGRLLSVPYTFLKTI